MFYGQKTANVYLKAAFIRKIRSKKHEAEESRNTITQVFGIYALIGLKKLYLILRLEFDHRKMIFQFVCLVTSLWLFCQTQINKISIDLSNLSSFFKVVFVSFQKLGFTKQYDCFDCTKNIFLVNTNIGIKLRAVKLR